MKLTIDIPEPVFQESQARAAQLGKSLEQYCLDALESTISSNDPEGEQKAARMELAGALKYLGAEEHENFRKLIEEEFERIEPEDY